MASANLWRALSLSPLSLLGYRILSVLRLGRGCTGFLSSSSYGSEFMTSFQTQRVKFESNECSGSGDGPSHLGRPASCFEMGIGRGAQSNEFISLGPYQDIVWGRAMLMFARPCGPCCVSKRQWRCLPGIHQLCRCIALLQRNPW